MEKKLLALMGLFVFCIEGSLANNYGAINGPMNFANNDEVNSSGDFCCD